MFDYAKTIEYEEEPKYFYFMDLLDQCKIVNNLQDECKYERKVFKQEHEEYPKIQWDKKSQSQKSN